MSLSEEFKNLSGRIVIVSASMDKEALKALVRDSLEKADAPDALVIVEAPHGDDTPHRTKSFKTMGSFGRILAVVLSHDTSILNAGTLTTPELPDLSVLTRTLQAEFSKEQPVDVSQNALTKDQLRQADRDFRQQQRENDKIVRRIAPARAQGKYRHHF